MAFFKGIILVTLIYIINICITKYYLDKKTSFTGNRIIFESEEMVTIFLMFAFILVFFQKWLKAKRKYNYFAKEHATYTRRIEQIWGDNSPVSESYKKKIRQCERYMKIHKINKRLKWYNIC